MPYYSSIQRQPTIYHFDLFLYRCSSLCSSYCSLHVMVILYVQFPIVISFVFNSGISHMILNTSQQD